MPSYVFNGQDILIDDQGYLINRHDWSRALAEQLAADENITLNDEIWQIIHFVRNFYEEYDTSPAIRILVKALAQEFGPEVGNSRYLHRLLPGGPAKMASKLAGLPKPAKCL